MPTITVENGPTFEATPDKRLVLAIEENGVDILHRCGGNARCTTCRVQFVEGEPAKMTEAEYERLTARELFGQARLSCQILCDHDMTVRVMLRVSSGEFDDAGPQPQPTITPEPVWMDKPEG